MADPLVFSDLYNDNGLGFLIGDTSSGSETDRKRAVNDAYIELAGIKGFWRKRSFNYTSSSSPALAAGTQSYDTPTTTGAVFDSPYRLYYREAGYYVDVPFVADSVWLELSATRSTDAQDPRRARLIQNSDGTEIELSYPISSSFIDRIGTLTLEYWIRLVHLSADGDVPITPANLNHHIVKLAGYKFALGQSDFGLADRLKGDAELAKAQFFRHDLTRTGRPRQIRPSSAYAPRSESFSGSIRDYGEVL